METLVHYPRLVLVVAFLVLWFVAWVGLKLRERRPGISEDLRADYSVVLGATLTLLALIISFSFSMAIGRYDLRKSYEEAEANAIGTEYLRTDLLPANGDRAREQLRQYMDLRIQFYTMRDSNELARIDAETERLQNEMWITVSRPALTQPLPVVITLAVAGMNDVINSQGYTLAAWRNRIPGSAWALLFSIAIFCNALLGFGVRLPNLKLLMVLPLVVSVAFFLIADIDSPSRGTIRVHPVNLETVRTGMK
ncbi:hypothetical protein [Edaphobacter aggregans]|uniref:bestrophin-like domain n=1 Tax=Edaphobacter aggregans TaxID=570835 RepID=UPI000553F5C1|nr:hypothetical protein [Edaphobacter aggregans]